MKKRQAIKRFFSLVFVPPLLLVSLQSQNASAFNSPSPVDLGTSANFGVLGNTSITNNGNTVVTGGDVGSGPTGFAVSNFPPGVVTAPKTLYTAANAATTNANTALGLAYVDIAGRSPDQTFPNGDGQLNNLTLTPGVYRVGSATTAQLGAGTLTLDGVNNPNSIWIFQIPGTTFKTAGATSILLTRQAQACNVFWQVGTSATLGATSTFEGNLLADTSITVGNSATIHGRLLAGAVTTSGSVSLDTDAITISSCTVGAVSPAPLISVIKVPSPLSLPNGPGSVKYTFTVSNIGKVTMTNVSILDDHCSPLAFVSGDTNGNKALEVTEKWIYSCTTTVSVTTKNRVSVIGYSGSLSATDIAFATVVVSAPVVPPLINVEKAPDRFTLPSGGGLVTYTYSVTNPGTVGLSNVTISDDLCKAISDHSGDRNDNKLLDPGETWLYACPQQISRNTINTVTVTGSANGLTATDYAIATVVVTSPVATTVPTPGLPNTGIGPDETGAPWNVIIPAGILAALVVFFGTRNRRKI